MPSLFVIQGRDQGTRFELDDEDYVVGRTSDSAIQLHDTEVSRAHARLQRDGDTYQLRDLESSNGTYVNGKRIQESDLISGDQVQLGRTLLLYTGITAPVLPDLTDQVDIVTGNRADDGSRIVHSLGQDDESGLFGPRTDETSHPWLARARSNLQIMYRTALAVSHTLDIDQLLQRILDMIFEWVDADRGCIMLKSPENQQLVPKVRRHRRGGKADDRITISQTILDYVVERNEGVLTSNARDDDRWDPAQSILRLGVREAICVPMKGRYDLVGAIYIDTSIAPERLLSSDQSSRAFSQEHLKLMVAIAHQAALAVEDTSYYKALVQAERLAAVGQTIATLSHHIKNILQGVRGGSYLIELGLKDHASAVAECTADSGPSESAGASTAAAGWEPHEARAARDAVEMIRKGWNIVERNQERITALVMDMLTFSKEREPEPCPSDLNEVTREVVSLMQARAEALDVDLKFAADDAMPTLMFDPEGLHRAILNLITNAIDACDQREDGQVEVATELTPSLAIVRVRDNGSGIPAEDLEQIFGIFVSRKGGRGTGLGLPVSQKIIKEHGGRITVESTPGQGSLFTLELPVVTTARSERGAAAAMTIESGPQ